MNSEGCGMEILNFIENNLKVSPSRLEKFYAAYLHFKNEVGIFLYGPPEHCLPFMSILIQHSPQGLLFDRKCNFQ